MSTYHLFVKYLDLEGKLNQQIHTLHGWDNVSQYLDTLPHMKILAVSIHAMIA